MREARLGGFAALAAYVALLAGQLVIGAGSQAQGLVSGLWLSEAVAIALPALFALAAAGLRIGPYLGFNGVRWKHVLVAVALGVLNQPVVSFLTWIAHGALPAHTVQAFDDQQRMLDALFSQAAVPMTITVTLAAPLGEEIFFRGFALPALSRSWGVAAGVVISGALFSALHMNVVGFLGLMEIGVLLAALRLWSGSLWPAMIAHAVNNGIAGGAFLLGMQDPDQPTPWYALVAGAVLLAAALPLLWRVLRGTLDAREEPAPSAGRQVAFAVVAGLVWMVAMAHYAPLAWGQIQAQLRASSGG